MSWWRNGLDLVGKGASDGGSVDVDFEDDAFILTTPTTGIRSHQAQEGVNRTPDVTAHLGGFTSHEADMCNCNNIEEL